MQTSPGGDAGTLRLRGGRGSWGAPDYGITSAEVAQLVKLREMLAPELEEMGDSGLDFQSDERMYRVYRTAGFSLEASVKYFRTMKEWRKKALACPAQPPQRDDLCAVSHHSLTCWGSGFLAQGSGFRVQGPGSRVQGSGFRD